MLTHSALVLVSITRTRQYSTIFFYNNPR